MSEKITIIGFGYIGKVLSSFFIQKGYEIIAIETDKQIINKYRDKEIEIEEKDIKSILNKNLKKIELFEPQKSGNISKNIFITVGTPLVKNKPSMKYITEVARFLSLRAPRNSIITLKSTIIPGTSEKLLSYFIKKNRSDLKLIYSPERLAEGTALRDLKKNPLIISSFNRKTLYFAEKFWKKNSIKTILFNDFKSAEICKLASNMWIDLNIALGNEIGLYCNTYGLDSKKIINATNTLKKGMSYINILSPSIGVGGYCLTKDPYFLKDDAKKNKLNLRLPSISRSINDQITLDCLNIIFKKARKVIKLKKDLRVIVFGLSFKNNTGDCRNTPVEKVISYLDKKNIDFDVFDPLVSEKDYWKLTSRNNLNLNNLDLKKYNLAIYACGHNVFKSVDIKKMKNLKLIFDGRQFFNKNQIKFFKDRNIIYSTI